MSAEIRPATRGDFPCIWGLLKSKAEFDGGADLLRASYEEAETALFGDNPCATVLIAVVDGVPVGIATSSSRSPLSSQSLVCGLMTSSCMSTTEVRGSENY